MPGFILETTIERFMTVILLVLWPFDTIMKFSMYTENKALTFSQLNVNCKVVDDWMA